MMAINPLRISTTKARVDTVSNIQDTVSSMEQVDMGVRAKEATGTRLRLLWEAIQDKAVVDMEGHHHQAGDNSERVPTIDNDVAIQLTMRHGDDFMQHKLSLLRHGKLFLVMALWTAANGGQRG